jgi:glycosyltransferase involved in cell wall biosynthesis
VISRLDDLGRGLRGGNGSRAASSGGMSSIIEIVNVVEAGWPRGRIDLPAVGATVYGESLDVEGWVLGDQSPARAVEGIVDGGLVTHAPLGVLRPDIAAQYPDIAQAGQSGFFLTIEAPRTPVFDLHVRAVLADDSRHELGLIQGRRGNREVPARGATVSVVIPCHNQARFIADAIESLRAQTYSEFDVIVVDDGSTDGSADIVERFGVPIVRQERGGPAAARNAGFRATTGDYVVFLDGDNMLERHALEANLHAFEDHPESAFVGGRYRYIDERGGHRPSSVLPDPKTPDDHYAALLSENYFGSPDNVMFRRSVLDAVGLFDSSVDGLEDYDLYLRIAKEHPVHYHGVTISAYRVHDNQFSRDQAMMLRSAVTVLRRQKNVVTMNPRLKEPYERGLSHWRTAYGGRLADQLRGSVRRRRWSEARRAALTLLRYHPRGLVSVFRKWARKRTSRLVPGSR